MTSSRWYIENRWISGYQGHHRKVRLRTAACMDKANEIIVIFFSVHSLTIQGD